MPKRGERQSHRVVFAWEGGPKGRVPKRGAWEAGHEAEIIARRAASIDKRVRVDVVEIAEDGTETVLRTLTEQDGRALLDDE